MDKERECPDCQRPIRLCVCDGIDDSGDDCSGDGPEVDEDEEESDEYDEW